jgi:DNA replication protein DnaC
VSWTSVHDAHAQITQPLQPSWVEITAAMLDRLLHRAAVVGIDGPSYRLRAHQRHASTIRAAANHKP